MKNKFLDLFLTFLKIGATTFGGGYAMIPLIRNDVVDKKRWLSEEELLEVLAIAESTPGPIAINVATYTGYKIRGFWGSLLATLGVVLPSFFIIFGISILYSYIKDNLIIAARLIQGNVGANQNLLAMLRTERHATVAVAEHRAAHLGVIVL